MDYNYEVLLKEIDGIKETYEYEGWDTDNVELIERLIKQSQKQEKLLGLYKEYFILSNVVIKFPKSGWNTYYYNRIEEVKNEIKELENE